MKPGGEGTTFAHPYQEGVEFGRAIIAIRWGSGEARTQRYDDIGKALNEARDARAVYGAANVQVYIDTGEGWSPSTWRNLDAIWGA